MKGHNIPNWFIYGILSIAAFLFVFFFSTTTSPLYEHYPFWYWGDSGIFQEMGICLLRGGTPYVDLFDHKGPILWFIQALGIGISHSLGLLFLQSISLFFTIFIWYRTTILICKKKLLSLITTILILLFLLAFYEHGNLCEEWSLPFISLPIYLYMKRWKAEPHSIQPIFKHIDAFIMGLCVGIIAMIRINNTAPLIGFTLWHFIRCIQNKEYRRMWIDITLIIAGMSIIFVSCSLFYLIKAGWSGVYEMIYGTFVFNFKYFNLHSHHTSSFLSKYIIPIGFIIITVICFFKIKLINNIIIPLIISYLLTFISLGKLDYGHYIMIFIPLFVISSCLINNVGEKWIYILPLFFIILSIKSGYNAIDYLLFRLRGRTANNIELNDGFHRFVASIAPDECKSIYNNGLYHMGSSLFADENIYQCNRFIYQDHIDLSSQFQKYAETHGIKELQPTWVLTQSPRPVISDDYFATHYSLADSIPGGEYATIWCWKKIRK